MSKSATPELSNETMEKFLELAVEVVDSSAETIKTRLMMMIGEYIFTNYILEPESKYEIKFLVKSMVKESKSKAQQVGENALLVKDLFDENGLNDILNKVVNDCLEMEKFLR